MDLASVIIVTYNSLKYIDACLCSIQKQKYPHEIIIVDNCSQDHIIDHLKKTYPEILLIQNTENGGYGAGNNLGVNYAKGKFVVIVNPDVIVASDWLETLINSLQNNPLNIVTPKILLYDGSLINTCGNINNFTGLTFTRGLGVDPIKEYCHDDIVTGISGACFALFRESYLDLGGFDENFFLYNEDSDFSWKANLFGYSIILSSKSILYHDYELKMNPKKIYYLEKGRYLILRKYLSRKIIIYILPSLIIAEILTIGFSARFGLKGLKNKIYACISGLTLKVIKINGDRENLIFRLNDTIPDNQLTFNRLDRTVKIVANKVFQWNFRVIKSKRFQWRS